MHQNLSRFNARGNSAGSQASRIPFQQPAPPNQQPKSFGQQHLRGQSLSHQKNQFWKTGQNDPQFNQQARAFNRFQPPKDDFRQQSAPRRQRVGGFAHQYSSQEQSQPQMVRQESTGFDYPGFEQAPSRTVYTTAKPQDKSSFQEISQRPQIKQYSALRTHQSTAKPKTFHQIAKIGPAPLQRKILLEPTQNGRSIEPEAKPSKRTDSQFKLDLNKYRYNPEEFSEDEDWSQVREPTPKQPSKLALKKTKISSEEQQSDSEEGQIEKPLQKPAMIKKITIPSKETKKISPKQDDSKPKLSIKEKLEQLKKGIKEAKEKTTKKPSIKKPPQPKKSESSSFKSRSISFDDESIEPEPKATAPVKKLPLTIKKQPVRALPTIPKPVVKRPVISHPIQTLKDSQEIIADNDISSKKYKHYFDRLISNIESLPSDLLLKSTLLRLINEEQFEFQCLGMCPASEIAERTSEGTLEVFEKATAAHPDFKPIKRFKRSSADTTLKIQSILRRPYVLLQTVQHILSKVVDAQDIASFAEIYGFVDDRFRSIRQDFNIIYSVSPLFRCSKESILTHETMVRFYLVSLNELRQTDKFDEQPVVKAFSETLKTLISNYIEVQNHRRELLDDK